METLQLRAIVRGGESVVTLRGDLVDRIERHPLPGGLTRIDVRVANEGYLGSYVMPSAMLLAFNEPVTVLS